MRIPSHTKKPRFYVATNDPRVEYAAIASWKSLDEAISCVLRWKEKAEEEPHHYQPTYDSITGIVETGPNEPIIHLL